MAQNESDDPVRRANIARAERERMLSDPHRPRYHFTVPEGVAMPFDPNGAIFWRGRYHLFYIFQDHRGHCWGHASTADLVHWTHHPTALAPQDNNPDKGIFSGNAFVTHDGHAALLYHGVDAGNCIALSDDDELIHWSKLPTNPIVPSPKNGDPQFGLYESWDPHGWADGEGYWAIFGGRPATLFHSTDMTHWRYLHPFIQSDAPLAEPDEDVSCPDFFRLGDKHVLLCISHRLGCRYYVGRYENHVFLPESHHRMNWPGGTCFAPESLLDAKGRRIMWAWVIDRRSPAMLKAGGSSGEMSLPRVLTMGDDDTLRIEPAEELQTLRHSGRTFRNVTLEPDADTTFDGVAGDCMELELEIDPGTARQVVLSVRCSPDGAEVTPITFDRESHLIRIDLSRSSLDAGVVHRSHCIVFGGASNPPVTVQEAPFALAPGEMLKLRVFLDRSMLEIFANSRQCMTQRVYPTRSDSRGIRLRACGGSAIVRSLNAWQMSPANAW